MRNGKKNSITILEATKRILKDHPEGLTYKEITDLILKNKLYVFSTPDPSHVVHIDIRRRCVGVEMASSHKIKQYRIVSQDKKGAHYGLIEAEKTDSQPSETDLTPSVDITEEEKILEAYHKHKDQIGQQLIEKIMNNTPAFFEKVVVDLLLKMGYGHDEYSGKVTGKSHDNGIDGVIMEDRLGLDKLYIQAKRYAPDNTVGSKELQAFVGAMHGVSKGVFITTSSYSKEAMKYYQDTMHTDKHLVLIDGKKLVSLLIDYGVGVVTKLNISILSIDDSFFE